MKQDRPKPSKAYCNFCSFLYMLTVHPTKHAFSITERGKITLPRLFACCCWYVAVGLAAQKGGERGRGVQSIKNFSPSSSPSPKPLLFPQRYMYEYVACAYTEKKFSLSCMTTFFSSPLRRFEILWENVRKKRGRREWGWNSRSSERGMLSFFQP